jgi:phenylacetaldehyde dehydrogenase
VGQQADDVRARTPFWKIGDLIYPRLDELAQLESLDNGKPYAVARAADVPLSADMFHYMTG